MSAAEMTALDLAALGAQFVGVSSGGVSVMGADAEMRYDDGPGYVFLKLALSPPAAGHQTWSTEDLFELRQEIRRRLAQIGGVDVQVSYVGGDSEATEAEEPPVHGVKARRQDTGE